MTRSAAQPRTTPDGFEPGALVSRRAADDMVARLAPASYDAEARTVEAIFSTGARVRRWGIIETLAVSPEAIDLSRVAQGAVRVLDTHDQFSIENILGVVTDARIENGQLVGTFRFADTERARTAETMVRGGDLTGISVGYRVTAWALIAVEEGVEVWRAERWELLEVSLVAVPADPAAMVRSGSAHSQTELDDMRRNVPSASGSAPAAPAAPAAGTPPAPAPETRAAPAPAPAPVTPAAPDADASIRAERARAAEIMTLGRQHGIEDAAVNAAIANGTDLDAFRSSVLDTLASRSEQTRITSASVGASADDPERVRAVLGEALVARMAESGGARVTPSEQARSYMGHSLVEMAAVSIGRRTMPRTARERLEVLERAFHSTSDFPLIFSGAINTRLEASYQAAQPVYRQIARQQNFMDFRAHDVLRAGDFPMLQKITQAGEIKFGSFGEKKETVMVAPYGIQFALTRQMLVNDNLGAIDQILAGQGTTVALFEETTFFAMKGTTGPTLKEDNTAVYHANHGNLAGAGTAIDVANLSAGRAGLRKMKRLDGNPMNLAPRILLVGPDKETEAQLITAQVTPTQASNVNPFSGTLETVVSSMIAGNAWELYSDLTFGANWQWGLLDGYTAPRLRIEEPFGVSGVAVSLEHDFGCGAIDFRFGYRNPGN
ncbi:prohead protease/major capsid protein fusion protein [Xanthobacter aminoxidans]|uniref:prohead protease/major capsid protein fusion protein n=1 Tax=Xanthobacter aminoxidans TaxID=186280 RepID=UPI003727051F